MKKKNYLLFICFTLLLSISSCNKNKEKIDDVIVLFTNDVHCAIDNNIGYAGVSAYKKDLEEKYNHVLLVDCGDFSQGAYEGAVSKGEYIIDIMNEVGYDYAIFGNHEFDYGAEQLKKNVLNSTAQFLNTNITYIGNEENWLEKYTKAYDVKEYGDIKIGFIGLTTPWAISNSSPNNFSENDQVVYDFSLNKGGEYFYSLVQENVDKCLDEGANYVVCLSHLGVNIEGDSPFTSIELIKNTTGINVVLDAHSHTDASCWVLENEDGDNVLLSSTGTTLNKIGQLVLTQNGSCSVGYVDSYTKKDEKIENKIKEIRENYLELASTVVGHLDFDLLTTDNEGIRMVRSRETAIGDFVSDAYRIIGGADIGMCNGGGIRADFKKGDITYKDIIDVNPYGNSLCVVKVKGKEIIDMLEYFYRHVKSEYKENGRACGEDGSFQHVSGLQFKIDTSIEADISVDENDNLISVNGNRRIKDVKVLENGYYVPIDLEKTYTLASHNYMIKNGGSGMLLFLANHELLVDESIADYQVLIDYIDILNGDLSAYKSVDERIIVN